jgi:hypothetical protein
VPLLGLLEAANATGRVRSRLGPIIDGMMDYVLAHTNKTNGWIGPFLDEPGDNNGHGLWDPLNMIRTLFMYAEFRPEREAEVALAVVAHLTEEAKLLRTDPVRARRRGGGGRLGPNALLGHGRGRGDHGDGLDHLRSKKLVIESRWVSAPLAVADQLQPRRLNAVCR